MIVVELFSKDDCRLCDRVKETLLRVQERHPFELRETKIREGDEHFERMKDRIPVVHIDGEFAFQYRLHEEEFLRRLISASGKRRP
ncbi:MAG TPA: glutaredoxin family protein [Bacteroidota bacterium]|nr:glutaredoxin family protein [Bacteroidota bacterium]